MPRSPCTMAEGGGTPPPFRVVRGRAGLLGPQQGRVGTLSCHGSMPRAATHCSYRVNRRPLNCQHSVRSSGAGLVTLPVARNLVSPWLTSSSQKGYLSFSGRTDPIQLGMRTAGSCSVQGLNPVILPRGMAGAEPSTRRLSHGTAPAPTH
jgi:hypothetical protein